MAFKFSFNGTDIEFAQGLQSKSQQIISAVAEKMQIILIRLQQKIIGTRLPKSGILNANLSQPSVTVEGGNVTGTMSWLGRTDYYAINPLTKRGTKQAFVTDKFGRINLKRGHLKGATLNQGAEALYFPGKDGKMIFAAYAFHPPFPGPRLMLEELDKMRSDIRNDLMNTVKEAQRKSGLKRF